ncbi:MAG TPA: hypothetical protein VGH54_21725 [Mycobacterium sp.]|jgi:hypothetical protein|uniref:hypothetical protein n=1 Tax=Mycobacterium sp. TaxID=1785 RepID=UPI002F3FD73E
MISATVAGHASINGSEFHPTEIRFEESVEYARSETAVKPDPAWEYTDSNGHFHAFAEDGKTPTLTEYLVHVDCDGSCGGICEGEGYDEPHWKCAICGEEVEPAFIPDDDARTTGIPVVTSRSASVTVRGTGSLPRIGQQDNGDGTFILDARPAQVSLRARTGEGEMIGTGYASLSMTYRGGRAEWTITTYGARLLPRLAQPDQELAATDG